MYGAVSVTAKEQDSATVPPSPTSTVSQVTPGPSRVGVKHISASRSLLATSLNHVEAGKDGNNNTDGDHDNTGIFGKGARRTDNGRVVTILLVLNYMIGSGILNTSQTFLRSGLAATTFLYVIACSAVWLGAVVLILAAEAASKGGYGSLEDLDYTVLAARVLGKHGPTVVDLSIIVMNFGAVCSYIILVGGLTSSLLVEWSASSAAPGTVDVIIEWWQSFYFVAPVMVLFFVLPPCLVRHFSNLRWLSAFSFFAISAVVILVICGGSSYAEAERAVAVGETALDDPLVWWNWVGSVSKLGSVSFALSCSAAVLHSYSAMDKRTESEWKTVMTSSVTLGGVLCYGTGLAGYLAFRGATQGDILDNFTGAVAAFFKILVVVHLILYIPNETIILRHNMFSLMGHDVMDTEFVLVAAATVGVLGLMVIIVTTMMLAGIAEGDLFGYVLDLTGGITGSLLNFILPGMAYLAVTKDAPLNSGALGGSNVRAYRIGCRVVIVFGFSMLVFIPVAVVLSAFGM